MEQNQLLETQNSPITDSESVCDSKKRFWEIDFARGICVILMIFDHLMYSFAVVAPFVGTLFGTDMWSGAAEFAVWYWRHPVRDIIRPIIVCAFFVICGVSCTLSRSEIKRGALTFLLGCGITTVTSIVDLGFELGITILFGVLHMLGVAMLSYGLIDKLGKRIEKLGTSQKSKNVYGFLGKYLPCIVGVLLLAVYFIWLGHIENMKFVSDIEVKNESLKPIVSIFTQVKNYNFVQYSHDYFALLPYGAIVLLGSGIGKAVYRSKLRNYAAKADGKWNKPVCFMGRYALYAYVLHQVAAVVLIFLITLIFG